MLGVNVLNCRAWHVDVPGGFSRLRGGRKWTQCLDMRNFAELPPVPSDHLVPFTDQLPLAVAA